MVKPMVRNISDCGLRNAELKASVEFFNPKSEIRNPQ